MDLSEGDRVEDRDCHAEFTLSFDRFFDRLSMSGDERLAMT